jgi:GTP-binding protein
MKILSAEFIKSATEPQHYPENTPFEVAFAGRSNVGKSSLINALVCRKSLAKTSNTPGRTQVVNFFLVNRRYTLVDLPGYGFARVPADVRRSWKPMVETYMRERQNLRLVVLIMDIRRDPGMHEIDLLQWLEHVRIEALLVLTKIDKLTKNRIALRVRLIMKMLTDKAGLKTIPDAILFSAKTGDGRDTLWNYIEAL